MVINFTSRAKQQSMKKKKAEQLDIHSNTFWTGHVGFPICIYMEISPIKSSNAYFPNNLHMAIAQLLYSS